MKILFYSNEWSDFAKFVEVFQRLEEDNVEVAVSTHNKDLIMPLSASKFLVVTLGSYYPDAVVVMDGKNKVGKSLYYSELLEVLG